MSGQRRLNGDLRRLQVACFAHHDAVRVLAQKRTQGTGKGQTDSFVYWHLHDPLQIVFDGFLHGQQLRIDSVDLSQTGIERCRFSRTSRSGCNKNAVWTLDHFQQKIVDVIRHPQRFEL